jgi:DinB superfamily
MTLTTQLPQAHEYAPYYAPYIACVSSKTILDNLAQGLLDTDALLDMLPADKLSYAYADGKWTIAEVLIHIIDAERVFAYRALRFSRGDSTALAGFDENLYVPQSNAAARTLADICLEYHAVRQATIALYQHLSADMLLRSGMASGYNMSVRALGYVIAGHEHHHLAVIRERYMS